MKLTRISKEELEKLEWDSATLDMSFMDDYKDEVDALLQAQLDSCQKEHDKEVQALIEKHGEAIKLIIEQKEKEKQEIFEELSENEELLEVGRKAIEDALVEWRDERLSEFNRGNGLVIREKDGKDSSIIRFGPETALRIGLKAIGQAFKEQTLKEIGGKE